MSSPLIDRSCSGSTPFVERDFEQPRQVVLRIGVEGTVQRDRSQRSVTEAVGRPRQAREHLGVEGRRRERGELAKHGEHAGDLVSRRPADDLVADGTSRRLTTSCATSLVRQRGRPRRRFAGSAAPPPTTARSDRRPAPRALARRPAHSCAWRSGDAGPIEALQLLAAGHRRRAHGDEGRRHQAVIGLSRRRHGTALRRAAARLVAQVGPEAPLRAPRARPRTVQPCAAHRSDQRPGDAVTGPSPGPPGRRAGLVGIEQRRSPLCWRRQPRSRLTTVSRSSRGGVSMSSRIVSPTCLPRRLSTTTDRAGREAEQVRAPPRGSARARSAAAGLGLGRAGGVKGRKPCASAHPDRRRRAARKSGACGSSALHPQPSDSAVRSWRWRVEHRAWRPGEPGTRRRSTPRRPATTKNTMIDFTG